MHPCFFFPFSRQLRKNLDRTKRFHPITCLDPINKVKKSAFIFACKSSLLGLLVVTLTNTLQAQEVFSSEQTLQEKYLSPHSSALTPQEKVGLDIAKRQEEKSIRPITGKNGSITYTYGASVPGIVCAPLQVCDIALQPGEKIHSVNLGDTARWSVEPAITGDFEDAIQHIIIKPLDVGLETSVVVTTNRRTYHLRLRSTRHQYMPQVSFSYPEEEQEKWRKLRAKEEKETYEKTLPETGERIENLSFSYRIRGKAPWKPLRVFDNGEKTILHMPSSMKNRETPILLVLRPGATKLAEKVMVNYRIKGNVFIVDMLFDQAILLAGVGKAQQRIIIERVRGN